MPFEPMAAISGERTWQARPDDYVVVQGSAAAITLPDTGYRLVRVQVNAGSTPGAFQILYDGQSIANFPCGSNATLGGMSWAVTWPCQGTSLPVGLFTFAGGVSGVILTFSKGMSKGPSIDRYRSIRFTVTHAAAHATLTAFTAVTYSVAPAIPTGVVTFATVADDVFYWPLVGTGSSGAPAEFTQGSIAVHLAPPLPKATSLTPFYTNVTAAGTMDAYVGYDPQ
jgi:hypothetical protein